MTDVIQFMRWPFLASVLLPGLLVYLGLHVVRREIIFVDLALAQVAVIGSCVGVLLGHEPTAWQTYALSFGFTLVGAAVFTVTKPRDRRVPQEALIGIVYVVAAAVGVVLLSYSAHGDEELRRTLVGEILLVRPGELFKTVGVFVFVGLFHYFFRAKFLALSYGPNPPARSALWDFIFFVLFGVVVSCFVSIGGVLLTFSYLIIPAVCAWLLAESLSAQLWLGWLIATVGSIVGLVVSYAADWPTGAAIVCALGFVLVLVATYKQAIRCT